MNMYKFLLGILVFSLMTEGIWAQQSTWTSDEEEAFDRKLDSIHAALDDAFEPDEEDLKGLPDDQYFEQDSDNTEEVSEQVLTLRQVDRETWEKIKRDKRFLYKKKKPKKKKKKSKKRSWSMFDGLGDFFNSKLVKGILYFLLAGFLIYIIYLFIRNNNISFKRNIKDDLIEQEAPWEDVKRFDDWELALQNALRSGDYRLATRIYYLHTLQLLDRQEFIQYRDDRTNWFYVHKLAGLDVQDKFIGLTKSFDYIWYGEYQINKEQFDILQIQFQNFQASLE